MLTLLQLEVIGDLLATYPNYVLMLIEKHPEDVAELAHNELLIRKIRREDDHA